MIHDLFHTFWGGFIVASLLWVVGWYPFKATLLKLQDDIHIWFGEKQPEPTPAPVVTPNVSK